MKRFQRFLTASIVAVFAALVCVAIRPVPTVAMPSCVRLQGESYCQAWSHAGASVNQYEYVRQGETVDNWQNMITILRYNQTDELKIAIPSYMQLRRKFMAPGAQPDWMTPADPVHSEEASTQLVLGDGKDADTEHVVAYFFADPKKYAYGIIFSRHAARTATKAQYAAWVAEMQAMPVP